MFLIRPRAAIMSMTLGMIIWLGLMVLNLLEGMPSGSSLMCRSDLMGTGLQLHVGSMVTSSNSELGEQRGRAGGPLKKKKQPQNAPPPQEAFHVLLPWGLAESLPAATFQSGAGGVPGDSWVPTQLTPEL